VLTLILFSIFNIIPQQQIYEQSVKITAPLYPKTIITHIDNHSIDFITYSAYKDPSNKYYYVAHDTALIPTWLFVSGNKDELWHRGKHNGVECNLFKNDRILLHIKTLGRFKLDLLFRIGYKVHNTKYGVVSRIKLDNSYPTSIKELELIIFAFPQPKNKSVVVIINGHIKLSYPIALFVGGIKHHIDMVLENFGKRLYL
jgi:hypothetical protein